MCEYLNKNPLIKYKDFRKTATKLYDESNCNFKVENYTFSNIYYTWCSKSNLFNKFSIFTNNKTNSGNIYLRDYSYKYIYSDSGRKLFVHEHAIFISDYFIKKLRAASHFYIDGTFIYPPGFKQLLVVLYYDENKNKRYPGEFILINNKKEVGYKEALKSFESIITIEHTKNINLKGINSDFEVSLINAIKSIFPKITHTGCFFHYVRALTKKLKTLKLHKGKFSKVSKKLLHELFTLPYNFNIQNESQINEIFNNVINDNYDIEKNNAFSRLMQFKNYFINQWYVYFLNGTLDFCKKEKI